MRSQWPKNGKPIATAQVNSICDKADLVAPLVELSAFGSPGPYLEIESMLSLARHHETIARRGSPAVRSVDIVGRHRVKKKRPWRGGHQGRLGDCHHRLIVVTG